MSVLKTGVLVLSLILCSYGVLSVFYITACKCAVSCFRCDVGCGRVGQNC